MSSYPDNEPILNYGPDSEEREALKEEIDRQMSEVVEIPCVVNGEEIALVSAVSGEKRYVRTGGSDTSEDPLMKLGNCE